MEAKFCNRAGKWVFVFASNICLLMILEHEQLCRNMIDGLCNLYKGGILRETIEMGCCS